MRSSLRVADVAALDALASRRGWRVERSEGDGGDGWSFAAVCVMQGMKRIGGAWLKLWPAPIGPEHHERLSGEMVQLLMGAGA